MRGIDIVFHSPFFQFICCSVVMYVGVLLDQLLRLADFCDWFALGTACLVQEVMVSDVVEVPTVTPRGAVVCEIFIG